MRFCARRVPRILVTGFGPFPGIADNPTARLVRALAADPPPGVVAEALATEWAACLPMTARAKNFDMVLMFGVAGRARRIRYERLAHAAAGNFPDAAGILPAAPPPLSRRSALPVAALAQRARRAGFPVAPSSSAGTYICNASYAAALAGNPATLFVHVPKPAARGPLSDAGLERHARWLVTQLARRATPGGDRFRAAGSRARAR